MIRSFVEFAVKKPILNHFLLAFFVIMAIFAYQSIPKEVFPPSQRDKVVIRGVYSGASAEVLDKMAVDALEKKLKTITNIQEITASIQNGLFTITANIQSGSDKVLVLSDVKDAITSIKRDLPSDMDEPTAQILEQAIPLVQLAIAADMPQKVLMDHAESIKDEISHMSALSKISLYGINETELLISIDEKKIHAFGLNVDLLINALSNISSIFPVGKIEEQGKHLFVSTVNGEKDIERLKSMLLVVENSTIRLSDIAEVSFRLTDQNALSHFNGKPSVSINIEKSKDGNALVLVQEIREILAKYEKLHPELKVDVYSDTSVYIKNRLNVVISNIIFGVIMLFIALFLAVNRGVALVIAMGIPVSFIVALVAANLMGYSLNMLSLLGVLLALGMLVDEAIVVAENIYRHLEMGKDRMEAVIEGTVEMFPAILTATLTTIFAFLPLLLMSGDMGIFMRILPIMISILLLSSLLEAFYFLPLHAKDFIHVKEERGKTHDFWEGLNRVYGSVLGFVFYYKKRTLLLLVCSILVLMAYLGSITKFQLFPDFDVTQMYVSGKVNINNSLEETQVFVSKIEKILLEKFDMKKEVEHITSVVGMRLNAKNEVSNETNLFHIFIDLYEKKPDNFFDTYVNPFLSPEYDAKKLKRDRLAKEIAKDVQKWLKPLQDETFNGKKVFEEFAVVVPSAGVVAYDLEIALGGVNDLKLLEGVTFLKEALGSIEHVFNITDNATLGASELKLSLNSYGQSLGFSESSIAQTLRALYLKAEYSKMFDEQGIVSIKIQSQTKDSLKSLENFILDVPQSKQKVALSQVCDFVIKKSFARIEKEDGDRQRTVFGSFEKDKVSSAQIMEVLKPTFEKLKASGMQVIIKGEEKENKQVQEEMAVIFLISLFLIFITLVWMFDSTVLSLIILSTIPLSILGVFMGHQIMGLNLSLPGMMGVVGLAGVVVNDGLIMVDFIKKAKSVEEVITLAILRIRPIILTSVTTIIGLSTLMFFASGQALILQPMAVSLGFGVAWATVLNLIYVPLLYVVIKSRQLNANLKVT